MSDDILGLTIADGLAEITLNRPAQLNAINCDLAERLVEALAAIEADSSVKVVILKGAGRAFMAGGDLKDFHEAGERAPEAVERLIVPFHKIIRALKTLRAPVIAAVHGAVAGGGLALALACDFVIASRRRGVHAGLSEDRDQPRTAARRGRSPACWASGARWNG